MRGWLRWLGSGCAAVALCVGVATAAAAGGAPAYSLSDLGTVAVDFKFCTYESGANAVNNLGVAVGWSKYANNCDNSPAAAITVGGVFTKLPKIPSTDPPFFTEAIAVNDHGQSVGWSNLNLNLFTPRVAWLSNGVSTTALPELCRASCTPDRYGAEARDVNAAGRVVGFSDTAGLHQAGPRHAFLYTGGTIRDLGTLAGGTSAAYGINDGDLVVGESDGHAFLWNGSMLDLGTLGGPTSTATAINNANQVVGFSSTAGGAVHAFLSAGGKMADLGTLGGTWSKAFDVNRFGQVVGVSATAGDSAVHVFTWSDGVMQDVTGLLPPDVDFVQAVQRGANLVTGAGLGINNVGQIAGATSCRLATCFGGALHGALLTDTVAPTCATGATGTTAAGFKFVKVSAQDLGSGLRTIRLVSATNATVQIPPLHLATPRPVEITATQSSHAAFSVQLEVTDIAGNRTTCALSQPA